MARILVVDDQPVILLTGRREKKDVERAVQVGADDYVVKPVDPEILFAKVDSLLKRAGKETQFQEVAISTDCSFTMNLKIVGVSEIGLTLICLHQLEAKNKIQIESALFEEIGISPPILRVELCTEHPTLPGFLIRGQFVGLSEQSLQPLRVWIRSKSLNRAG